MTNLLALATVAKKAGVSLDNQMIFWSSRGKVFRIVALQT
jgi:hypothetical protein